MGEALKLTVYVGERDRSGGRLLADVLMDACERHGVRTSTLLRGLEGFGVKHRLQTERLLTLSEDLPILAVAIDTPARIQKLARELDTLAGHGLITLERVWLLDAADAQIPLLCGGGELKLSVHLSRQQRADGSPAHRAVVDLLHRYGVAGASVLLGVDGTTDGVRCRARFLAANSRVPAMVVSVGGARQIAQALPALEALVDGARMTLERVRVHRRDGQSLAAFDEPLTCDEGGLAYWQKLTVFSSERSRYGHGPLHAALVRRLRAEGAAGVTVLRGLWGYHGAHRPHGEQFWSLARSVPVVTVLLDTPQNMRRWRETVEEITSETGLVTSETVPALRTAGPGVLHGGLELASALAGRPPARGGQASSLE